MAETPEEKKARLQREAKARADEQRRRREEAAIRAAQDREKTRQMQDAYKEAGGQGMKRGGKIKKYARGGGIESKGKTRGRFV